jgi:hypothetical protein
VSRGKRTKTKNQTNYLFLFCLRVYGDRRQLRRAGANYRGNRRSNAWHGPEPRGLSCKLTNVRFFQEKTKSPPPGEGLGGGGGGGGRGLETTGGSTGSSRDYPRPSARTRVRLPVATTWRWTGVASSPFDVSDAGRPAGRPAPFTEPFLLETVRTGERSLSDLRPIPSWPSRALRRPLSPSEETRGTARRRRPVAVFCAN